MNKLYTTFQDSIYVGEKLPRKYSMAVGALELVVINELLGLVSVKEMLPNSVGFRDRYTFQRVGSGSMDIGLKAWPNTTGDRSNDVLKDDPLHFALLNLEGDPENPLQHDRPLLFSFIDDHLAGADKSERSRVDQRLYDHISDIAGVDEILQAIRMHRPLCMNLDTDTARATQSGRMYFHPGESVKFEASDKSGRLLKSLCENPWLKGRRDEQWLSNATQVRQHLAAF